MNDHENAYYRHEFIALQGSISVQYFYSCSRSSILVLASVHVASQKKRSGGAKLAGCDGHLNNPVRDQPQV
jgi:hypothetical protein